MIVKNDQINQFEGGITQISVIMNFDSAAMNFSQFFWEISNFEFRLKVFINLWQNDTALKEMAICDINSMKNHD